MESNAQGTDNFAAKMISTENVEKNVKEVRTKNQTYFFCKLLTWVTSLKLPSLENYSIFKIFHLECTKNDVFETGWNWSSKYKILFQSIWKKEI